MQRDIDPDEALCLVLQTVPRPRIHEIDISSALGRILAENIHSQEDFPPFNRAMMDGFAVRLNDAGRTVRCISVCAAGEESQHAVSSGTCVEIMTGAPCPPGTQTVVPIEHIQRNRNLITLPSPLRRGRHLVQRGSECRSERLVFPEGTKLTPLAIGLLAALGKTRIRVIAKPTLSLIITGKEIVDPSVHLGPAQIRDANGFMLQALAKDYGYSPTRIWRAKDTHHSITQALEKAVCAADVVVLTGGVSKGKHDIVPRILMDLGAKPLFHRVTQKPGKPLFFGATDQTLFFGLPGTPLGCHLCFHRYVIPALQALESNYPSPKRQKALLATDFEVRQKRTLFHLARIVVKDYQKRIVPLNPTSSADLFGIQGANVYARFSPGDYVFQKGTPVEYYPIRSEPTPYPLLEKWPGLSSRPYRTKKHLHV